MNQIEINLKRMKAESDKVREATMKLWATIGKLETIEAETRRGK